MYPWRKRKGEHCHISDCHFGQKLARDRTNRSPFRSRRLTECIVRLSSMNMFPKLISLQGTVLFSIITQKWELLIYVRMYLLACFRGWLWGSRYDDWIYWRFFIITINYDRSQSVSVCYSRVGVRVSSLLQWRMTNVESLLTHWTHLRMNCDSSITYRRPESRSQSETVRSFCYCFARCYETYQIATKQRRFDCWLRCLEKVFTESLASKWSYSVIVCMHVGNEYMSG
jgi:hypothetical protein